jgi:hypothetical protein
MWPAVSAHRGRLCAELVQRMKAAVDIGAVDGGSRRPGGIWWGTRWRGRWIKVVFARNRRQVAIGGSPLTGRRYVVAGIDYRGGRVQETIDIVTAAGAEVAAVLVLVTQCGKAHFELSAVLVV